MSISPTSLRLHGIIQIMRDALMNEVQIKQKHMRLIKVRLHREENVNGNKNNPGPDSHTSESHTFHPFPRVAGAGHFSCQS
jgi:hypothetical protein